MFFLSLLPRHVEWKTLHGIDASNPVCTTPHIALDLDVLVFFFFFLHGSSSYLRFSPSGKFLLFLGSLKPTILPTGKQGSKHLKVIIIIISGCARETSDPLFFTTTLMDPCLPGTSQAVVLSCE